MGGVENEELLASLSTLVRHENEITSDVLAHLAEVDERRLHLDLGFPSLFAYCVEALGFSESGAGRRIAAVRVCRRYPGAFEQVARGELHLSALCALAPHLDEGNAGELLEVCTGKTRRQVDELLAARFPKADVPDAVRVEPLSVDRYSLQFTIDGEALAELEAVRALARHRCPGGELAELFKLALRALKKDLEKQRFGVGRRPRARRDVAAHSPGGSEGPSSSGGADGSGKKRESRRIPAEVARTVYVRDGGECAFVAPDGRRCGSRAFLEIDHVLPAAVGGLSRVENLRLRCRAHNQQQARGYFGRLQVEAAIARATRVRRATAASGTKCEASRV